MTEQEVKEVLMYLLMTHWASRFTFVYLCIAGHAAANECVCSVIKTYVVDRYITAFYGPANLYKEEYAISPEGLNLIKGE